MEYIKDNDIIDANDLEKNFQLIQSIKKTNNDLKKAQINFEFAENELVDFYTYQIKALQAKLDYLTKVAKLKNIDFDIFNERAV